jgi:hypothetical protein
MMPTARLLYGARGRARRLSKCSTDALRAHALPGLTRAPSLARAWFHLNRRKRKLNITLYVIVFLINIEHKELNILVEY